VTRLPPGAYALIWLLVAVLMLYGSFYPFQWQDPAGPGPVLHLLGTWQEWDHRGDLVANIIFYMPFGFLGIFALPPRLPLALRIGLTVLLGTALSLGVELTQYHLAGRDSTLGDLYANAIGTAAGALVAAGLGPSPRWPLLGELFAAPFAALLLIAWGGERLSPYVPTIDLHKYWHSLWPLLAGNGLGAAAVAGAAVAWLLVAALLEAAYGRRRTWLLFPLAFIAAEGWRVMAVGTAVELSDVAGAVAAFALWPLFVRWRRAPLAVAMALLVAARIATGAEPVAENWLPFEPMMRNTIADGLHDVCLTGFLNGGLVWLLAGTGLGAAGAAVTTIALLVGTAVAAGQPVPTSDLFVAVAAGVLLRLLQPPRPSRLVAA
jgi:VanZ family protein